MFIYKLSSWLDHYDPYWYSRLMALKLVYITLILFAANTLLHVPYFPVFTMMVAGSGILLIESPSINTLKKKDMVYLVYTLLLIISIAIFGLHYYQKVWFIVVATLWCFALYTLLRKQVAMFPVLSLVLILSLMSLEGYNSGSFFTIINNSLYFIEFAIIVFWAHKLFPNLYYKIWQSAVLRNCESYLRVLEHPDDKLDVYKNLLANLLVAKNTMPLLEHMKYYSQLVRFNNLLAEYNYFILSITGEKKPEMHDIAYIRLCVLDVVAAISGHKVILSRDSNASVSEFIKEHNKIYKHLVFTWNRICKSN